MVGCCCCYALENDLDLLTLRVPLPESWDFRLTALYSCSAGDGTQGFMKIRQRLYPPLHRLLFVFLLQASPLLYKYKIKQIKQICNILFNRCFLVLRIIRKCSFVVPRLSNSSPSSLHFAREIRSKNLHDLSGILKLLDSAGGRLFSRVD